MYVRLSYLLETRVPAWPGKPQLQLEPLMQLSKGDAANTSMLHLHNHIGTHYDAPNHYLKDGLSSGVLLPLNKEDPVRPARSPRLCIWRKPILRSTMTRKTSP